jgi:aminopeptidase N
MLAFSLVLGVTSSARAAEPPVLTSPGQHTDSYYPSVGSPGVDVQSYALDLRWRPTTRTLDGTARLRLVPAQDGSFRLDLSGRLRVATLTIRDLRSGTVLRSTYSRSGHTLDVTAPGLLAGAPYAVTIAYRGRPAPTKAPSSRQDMSGLGWHTTRSGQVWAMQEPYGAFTWYPVNDHPSDKATYDVRLDVPRRWVGVSGGRMVSRTVSHGRTVTRFTSRDPMASYLATVAIGPYRRYAQTGPHGIPITYWVPRDKPQYLAPLKATPATLRWLESRLGPYPFDRAGVVVTPSGSAMETQTMITFGAENYRYGAREVQQTVAHELAHAWYGDTVTPDDWSDLWMNEGMAMYVEAAYSTARGWHSAAYWEREFSRSDALWRQLYGPPGAYHRDQFAQVNVYYCTARMLVRLRDVIGVGPFDDLMRRWPQEHRNTVQDRASYVAWLSANTGRDLAPFFDQWLASPTPPA